MSYRIHLVIVSKASMNIPYKVATILHFVKIKYLQQKFTYCDSILVQLRNKPPSSLQTTLWKVHQHPAA